MSYTTLHTYWAYAGFGKFTITRDNSSGQIILEYWNPIDRSVVSLWLEPGMDESIGQAYDFFMLDAPLEEREGRLTMYAEAARILSIPKDKWATPLMPAEGVVSDDDTVAEDITEEKDG